MHIVEFKTESKNGIIKLPPDFHELDNSKLKIIIIRDDDTNKTSTKIDRLNKLKTLINAYNPNIDPDTDIDKLANEVNNDIFYA